MALALIGTKWYTISKTKSGALFMTVWYDKKRKIYVGKFFRNGKQFKKEGFRTKKEAETWVFQTREEILNPPQQQELMTDGISLVEFANDYLDHCKTRMRPNTLSYKSTEFKFLMSHLGEDLPARDLTTRQINAIMNERQKKHGNKAANRFLREIKALYNWGIANNYLQTNPARSITKMSEEPYTPYNPPAEDVNRVLLAATPEELDIITCLYNLAARRSEVLNLKWDDVNIERRRIRLWTRKRRGGLEFDWLPMNDTLFELFQRRWKNRNKSSALVFCDADGKAYNANSGFIRTMMERLCKRADVPKFGFHSLRHHVAQLFDDSGKATLGQIQRFLRHKRPTTTDTYLKSIGSDLREMGEILQGAQELNKKLIH